MNKDSLKDYFAFTHYVTYRKEFYDQLSIVFSGKNISYEIQFAINSFLYFYPYLKKNIIIFDDYSTDDTLEWAKENDIRVITWSDKYKHFASNYNEIYKDKLCYSYKVDVMYNDIMEQITTKYLLLNDGDIFFCDYFLEDFFNYIKDGSKIVGNIETIGGDLLSNEIYKEKCGEDYIKRFERLLVGYRNELPILQRFHLFHALIDIEYLKSINMGIDDLNDSNLEFLSFPPVCDSGMNFTINVFEKEIPFSLFDYRSKECHVIHLGFRSSYSAYFDKFKNIEFEPEETGLQPKEHFSLFNNKMINENEKAKYIVNLFNFDILSTFNRKERN